VHVSPVLAHQGRTECEKATPLLCFCECWKLGRLVQTPASLIMQFKNSAGAHGMSRVSHWMQSRILTQERAPQTTRADFWSDPEKQSPRSRERFGKTFFRSLAERPRRLGQGSVSGWGFEPVPTNKTVVNWNFFVTPTTAAARLQMPKNHEPAVLLVED